MEIHFPIAKRRFFRQPQMSGALLDYGEKSCKCESDPRRCSRQLFNIDQHSDGIPFRRR